MEDKAIAEIVKFGGRGSKTLPTAVPPHLFHIDFLEQIGGVKTDIPVTFQNPMAPGAGTAFMR